VNNLESLLESVKIKDNKQWIRLYEKTQVASPRNGMYEILKNRASHSIEVASSSLVICHSLAEKNNLMIDEIDYQNATYNASLLHDVGITSFGHSGSNFINEAFIAYGLVEGFDDNNNNLVVIEKNNIKVRDYVKASVIKYPEKLYPDQKIAYEKILKKSISEDIEHFSKVGIKLSNRRRTIACDIMDEADRDSYVPSDLSDFLCSGNKLKRKSVIDFSSNKNLSPKYYAELIGMVELSLSNDKSRVKEYFSDLKLRFNMNHKLSEKGIEPDDLELYRYREVLNSMCHEFYINPIRKKIIHSSNMKKLASFISYVIEEEFYPSKYYCKLINNEILIEEKLKHIRNMISEVSDWYIITMYKKLNLKNRKADPELIGLTKKH